MKVKELIELLKTFDSEHNVVLSLDCSGSMFLPVYDCESSMYMGDSKYCTKEQFRDLKESGNLDSEHSRFKVDTVVIYPRG